MSGIELNKIVGAILTAALLVVVISTLGEALVKPKHHTSNMVIATAPAATTAPKKEEPLEPVGPLLASANVEAGEKQAKKCAACHDFKKGGKAKIGPPLWDTVGQPKGGHDGFSYSPALKKLGGTWDYESLNAFLHKPRQLVPGTKMTFPGLSAAKDRANLIAYLRNLSDQPKPLP